MDHETFNTNKVKYLDWDSEFFGFSIGRIYANAISAANLEEILENAVENNIKFVELFCDNSDKESIYSSERSGFRLADLKITLIKKLDGETIENSALNDLIFKKADLEDANKLKTIGKGLFKHSRYYRYQKFDPAKVDSMFQTWIEKSISGEFDDELYYLCNETDILAFCSLKYRENAASIGLMGIAESCRGKGLGSVLLDRIFHLLHKRKVTEVNVATQGENFNALHLYEKKRFYLSKITICYYKWMEPKEK
jgi:dTDP-4-amino-4,6-dideoxy-D-galactose acyltransferase